MLLDQKEKKLDKKINELSLENIYDSKDLKEMIQARQMKLEDLEQDINIKTDK